MAGNFFTGGVASKMLSTVGKLAKTSRILTKAKTAIKEAGTLPIAGIVGKATKGWIKKELYNELKLIDPSGTLRKEFEDAMKKGLALGEKNAEGIKILQGNGIDGFRYEVKIKGDRGSYRILGNVKTWTNPKTKLTESIIIFEKVITK